MKERNSTLTSTDILMALAALFLAILANTLHASPITVIQPQEGPGVERTVAQEPTDGEEPTDLPERRIVAFSTFTDVKTGEVVKSSTCRWEPSGEPCEPGTY